MLGLRRHPGHLHPPMHPTVLPLCLLLAALPAAAGPPAARTLGAIGFEPCTLSAAGQAATVAAFCGTLAVPEDRARPAGRSLQLAVAFVPSRSKQPRALLRSPRCWK